MSSLKSVFIPDEVVMSKIYVIRDQKVMLDEDLAEHYLMPISTLADMEAIGSLKNCHVLLVFSCNYV
ncbi:hypothetical protein [Pedobacter steynii]|uniref:KilA-N DNA-binding domain-containing protein n=1 Tax=Pedobacter steynii TaxID=430522 RepID=A0A1D7QME5_9SPHI|nr:hypothetical protein [Pedobacter steynii]AOM79836.1 hypothetical protein BFS30_23330 [Pedobacter steynii]